MHPRRATLVAFSVLVVQPLAACGSSDPGATSSASASKSSRPPETTTPVPLSLTASKETAGEMPAASTSAGGRLLFEYDTTNGAEYLVKCESLPKDAVVSIGAAKATVDATYKCALRVDISDRLASVPIAEPSSTRVAPADPVVVRLADGRTAQIPAPGVEVQNPTNGLWSISKGPLPFGGVAPKKRTLVYLHKILPGFVLGGPKVLGDVARVAIGEPAPEPDLVCKDYVDKATNAAVPAVNVHREGEKVTVYDRVTGATVATKTIAASTDCPESLDAFKTGALQTNFAPREAVKRWVESQR